MKLNHEIDGAAKVQFNFCSVSPLSTSRCRHAAKLAAVALMIVLTVRPYSASLHGPYNAPGR